MLETLLRVLSLSLSLPEAAEARTMNHTTGEADSPAAIPCHILRAVSFVDGSYTPW